MKRWDRDILLKETLRSEARGYHKLKKQTGGPGQFAIVGNDMQVAGSHPDAGVPNRIPHFGECAPPARA